jgi:hypothetical protein
MGNGSGLFSDQRPAKPHLVDGKTGVAGEVDDLRDDLGGALLPLAAITVDEFTDVAAADADGIKESIASVAAAVTYSGTDLDGATGGAVMSPPRNVNVTTAGATPADAPATATINGLDVDGNALSEDLAVPQTAITVNGTKAFAQVTSIVLTAGDGTGALLTFGVGSLLGLSKTIKSRAGALALLDEIDAGSLLAAPTATVADATTGAPHGTVDPSTSPNGTNDYAYYYEYDPTA